MMGFGMGMLVGGLFRQAEIDQISERVHYYQARLYKCEEQLGRTVHP